MIKREFFKKYLGISNSKVLDELERHSEIWKVKKREIVITGGEILIDIPFLISGVLKARYYKASGAEKVYCFAYQTGEVVASIKGIHGTVRALCTVEAVQDSELCYVPLVFLQKLIQNNSHVAYIYEQLLSASMEQMMEHEKQITICSPTERYEWFQKKYPMLEEKVSKKDIASYLDMSPEHFSRIKRQKKSDLKLTGNKNR